MTLRELLVVVRPAQKIRLKQSMNDQGLDCLRYEILDESGLFGSTVPDSVLDRTVVVMHTLIDENRLLIRVR